MQVLKKRSSEGELADTRTAKKPLRVKKVWKVLLVILLVLAILAVAASKFLGRRPSGKRQTEYSTAEVSYRTITESLSGSGTLQPANSYTVITLVEGEVLSADFEEGDIVEKDDVLYQIDSSNVANNIEKSQISLSQAQRNYADTTDNRYVRANISGQLYELNVSVGDEVNQGQQIATLRNSSTMKLVVPFPADDAVAFYAGQTAEITLNGSFETLTGTVDTVSGSDIPGIGNTIYRNVTILVQNPGSLNNTQVATASINGIGSAENGTFTYSAESKVTASASGTVTAINTKEGASVTKEQILVTLGGSKLENSIQSAADSLRNAEISMDSTQNQLDNYTVTSPISGTIVDKSYKAGDNAEAGKTLCIIYDLSYLEMTIDIDELDISKVSAGQKVQVTADAVEGKTYEGVITKVSVVGTTGSGGVTTYPATVRIDRCDGLRPGMNVDAEIVLEQADNALAVPNSAVNRGNIVLITKDSPSAVNALDREAPDGYVYVEVKTGLSDDSHIQILDGLQSGDTVAYTQSAGTTMVMGMPGGMGGMPGGMSGGMSGGMPSGSRAPSGGMPSGGGGMRGGPMG